MHTLAPFLSQPLLRNGSYIRNVYGPGDFHDANLLNAFAIIVVVNIWLALFNLVPIPPLDGSKVLAGILPGPLADAYDTFRRSLERMGVLGGTLIVLIVFYYLLAPFLVTLLQVLFSLLTGVSL